MKGKGKGKRGTEWIGKKRYSVARAKGKVRKKHKEGKEREI